MIEVCAADAAHGTIMSVNNSLFCNGILKYGTEEQKQKLRAGDRHGEQIGAYALTEPQSGSDASTMKSRAVLSEDGSHYTDQCTQVLDHVRALRALPGVVCLDQSGGRCAKGISAFLIDTEKEGFQCGKTEPKLGIRASATCEIELTDYRCPVEDRLGDEGPGLQDRHERARRRPHRYCRPGGRDCPGRL
jgi:alkylation response protein AidB-like acyl-CoA dehydrogenase